MKTNYDTDRTHSARLISNPSSKHDLTTCLSQDRKNFQMPDESFKMPEKKLRMSLAGFKQQEEYLKEGKNQRIQQKLMSDRYRREIHQISENCNETVHPMVQYLTKKHNTEGWILNEILQRPKKVV